MNKVVEALLNGLGQIWGMFCGTDKKLSARRLLGTALIISGIVLAYNTRDLPIPENLYQLIWNMVGLELVLVGAWVWNFVTIQNIKTVIGKDK
jgi:hypothetical protein